MITPLQPSSSEECDVISVDEVLTMSPQTIDDYDYDDANRLCSQNETRRYYRTFLRIFTCISLGCLLLSLVIFFINSSNIRRDNILNVGIENDGALLNPIENSQSSSSSNNGTIVVEFTVANLNTNAVNCTVINRELQCIPFHNNATNKFRIRLHPKWAPIGVDRFMYLTNSDFWHGVRIFRIVPNFVSQFGISSYPNEGWTNVEQLLDDPSGKSSNSRGTVTFATSGENTRTTQVFINTANNEYLDNQGFAPIGEVLMAGDGYGGMDVVQEFYSGYGDRPDQNKIKTIGEEYLIQEFPLLSYLVSAEVVN